MNQFLYEICKRSNMYVRGRDGDKGSNGISINQGIANIPKSHQILGDIKSMLSPLAQGKPVLTTIRFCIYEFQHCGRTPDALNYCNYNCFWWLPMETSHKTMRRWEYSLSMKTKWCGVGEVAGELLLMSSRSKRRRMGEVIISQRKAGDIEKSHLPGAVAWPTETVPHSQSASRE